MRTKLIYTFSLYSILVAADFSLSANAQTFSSSALLPDAPLQAVSPQPQPAPRYYPSDGQAYTAGAFCGLGASTSIASTRPNFGCGAGMSFAPLPIFFEVGVMGPQASRSNVSGYLSLDGHIPLVRSGIQYMPIAIVGYSRLFETGHALDYGISLATPRWNKQKRDHHKSMRIELRDYWTFANPAQHNIMLRVGWMTIIDD